MTGTSTLIERLLRSTDNIDRVAMYYVQEIGLKVTSESLRKAIEEHPDYPSLLAINDALESFGAETVAARLNETQLRDLDQPYITQVRLTNGRAQVFTVVRPSGNGHVSYLHPERDQWVIVTVDEFADLFGGVVLVAVAGERAGEKDYRKKQKEARKGFIIRTAVLAIIPILVLSAITLGLLQYGLVAIIPAIYLLLATVGAMLGLLLLLFEIDRHNPALKQICSGSKNINCGAVLSSSASKIFGISWSLIGFTYFGGASIALLTGGLMNIPLLNLLSWLSLLALGYTMFSLYYQWRVTKQWCMLCLAAQGILLSQAILVLIGGQPFTTDVEFSIASVLTLATSFALPFLTGLVVIPVLKKAKEGENHRRELSKLKHNPQVFRALLEKERAVTESACGLGIMLGNPNAKHQIIKVCNPYCGPCAKAHPAIEDILGSNLDVQVRIIFTADNDDKDRKAPPVKHLMALAEKGDEPLLKKALDDWYGVPEKNYGAFSAKYPMNGELGRQGEKLVAMRAWCNQMEIAFTPTFFVDGYQLPEVYTIKDLDYFLKM